MHRPLVTLVAFSLLAAIALAAAPARGQDAADPKLAAILTTAQKVYDEGKYQDAHAKLDELRKLAPTHPGLAELAKSVDAAIERERLAASRSAAFPPAAEPKTAPPPDAAARAAREMLPPEPSPTTLHDSRRLYQRAEELLDKGQYDPARQILAEIGPDDPEFDRARLLRLRIDAWEARRRLLPPGGDKKALDDFTSKRTDRQLTTALQLFSAGKWRETIDACERILDYAPDEPRARRLLLDARTELTDAHVRQIELESELRVREFLAESTEDMTPPKPGPKLTRPKTDSEILLPSLDEIELEKKLNEKVSIDLIEAPLSYVLDLLSRSIGVNIIVDPAAVQDKTLTINVQNTTLKEVLDFITRNEGVSFTKGKNTVYVTTPDQPMLIMRIFHLSKGLTDVGADMTPQAAQQGGGGPGAPPPGKPGQPAQPAQPPGQQPQGQAGTGAKASGSSDIEKLLDQLPNLIIWPTGSTYYLDRKRNVLFLRSTPEALDQVEKMLAALDDNPIQVLVTTRFIEIDAEYLEDLGTQWNLTADYALAKKAGADKLVIDAATGTTFLPRVAAEAGDTVSLDDGLSFGITGILTEPQFQLTIRTIMSKYKGRVVNNPQVIAMNNSAARFQESEDLWYIDDYRIDRTDLTGAEGVITSEPVIVPVFAAGPSIGFSLTVTPSVGKDSRDITLLLEPIFRRKSINSVTSPLILPGGLGTINIERPIVVDRRLWAKVTIRDGYHVALGGMVSATKKEIVARVPILGDVPLLGWLFRRSTVRDVRKHLLVFVSARILNPQGRMYKTDDEERDEELKKQDLKNPSSLPEGLGFKSLRGVETRQLLGPKELRPAEADIIDTREIELKPKGAEKK